MYYLFNYTPIVVQIIIFLLHILYGTVFDGGIRIIYIFFLLLITPSYLLFVNVYYQGRKYISYTKSIACMISVPIVNVLPFLMTNKMQTGNYVGDVPIGIYVSMMGVPVLIILCGMLIISFLDKRRRTKGDDHPVSKG